MKYELFGMKPMEENIAWATEHCFCRATPSYLLIYTKDGQPEKSIPVQVGQLTAEDLMWLQSCNMEIIQETVERSSDVREKAMVWLKKLEEELEKEWKKVEGHGG